MFAYAANQKDNVFKSANDFQTAKEKFLARKDREATQIETTPLFKKFMSKLDPAKYGKDQNQEIGQSRFLNDRMRQYFSEQNLYSAPNTVGSQAAQNKIIGEMLDESDAKNTKRLAASMAPGAFLALGAGLGLAVAPIAGVLAAGAAAIGFVKTSLDWRKDEKEMKELSTLMREAHKFQNGEGPQSSAVERLKHSQDNTLQLLKRMGASDQKIASTLASQKLAMSELRDGTKFKKDNTPSWKAREEKQQAKAQPPQQRAPKFNPGKSS